MRTITYTAIAVKQLARIDRADGQRIRAKIEQYATDPKSLANQVKKLTGLNALRLRVGEYRVIFTDDGMVLLILKIGHRSGIYD